jgi:hypothetical protein
VITGLDHVVLLVNDIGTAATAHQTLFGCAPSWRSAGDGADRVLFTFDNMTLELMSPKGFSVAADRIRAVIAEQGEGLASICFGNERARQPRRRAASGCFSLKWQKSARARSPPPPRRSPRWITW